MAGAAYLGWWITGLILLLLEKKNEYIKFHAMQSTILFGGITVIYIFLWFIPLIGWMINTLILPLLVFILWIVLMWKAFTGERYKVPYVGEVAEKQLAKMG